MSLTGRAITAEQRLGQLIVNAFDDSNAVRSEEDAPLAEAVEKFATRFKLDRACHTLGINPSIRFSGGGSGSGST